MARKTQRTTLLRRCEHAVFPVEVTPTKDGSRARCLGCGQVGPVRASSKEALQALREEPRPLH